MTLRGRTYLSIALLFIGINGAFALDFPALSGHVVDEALLLNNAGSSWLNETIGQFEASHPDKIIVVTLPSLQGVNIEDYTTQLAAYWRISQQNTVILVVAPSERKLRLQVGRNLQDQLTDAESRVIVDGTTRRIRTTDVQGSIIFAVGQIIQVLNAPHNQNSAPRAYRGLFTLFDFNTIAAGVSFGIGLLLVLLIYAAPMAIINFIVHGNLPHTLPVYADDIEVLFKRSQRINWYGRVVFGITARLGMTDKQLALVRQYWLGRVVAFDSLRRQRQNELARLHWQFAKDAKSDAHDKKKFWSRRWATFRTFIKRLFWIFTAFFGFILSFLFIRVTIAKLARGKLIESKDLVLLVQAKEAIEDSAKYLKEYLELAETFDGREELFEPE